MKIDSEIERKMQQAIDSIIRVSRDYKMLVVGSSFGKDSTVLVDLVIKAYQHAKVHDLEMPILVVHTNNTGVEMPEILLHSVSEGRKLVGYCQNNGIDVQLSEASPSMVNHWAVSLMTGRKLPTYPDRKFSECSVDLKVNPGTKAFQSLLKQRGMVLSDALIMLGTRFEESASRESAMREREETDFSVARNAETGDSFAPIASWDTLEIWTYLSYGDSDRVYSTGEPFTSYSDFTETHRIYADANSGEGCHILGEVKKSANGCGARHGCFVCARVSENTSLKAMVESNPRYDYMKPLLPIQQFIVNNQYDWTMRNPVGRTLSTEGFLSIQPDTLHPNVILQLFEACLTIDRDSAEEAERLGLSAPRIQPILNIDRIVYLDAIWSLRGFFEPYAAWRSVRDIYSYDRSFYFGESTKVKKTPIPKKRFLDVRPYYQSIDETTRFRLWAKSFSVREGCAFVEDGDVYDFVDDDPLPGTGYSIPTSYEQTKAQKLAKAIEVDTTNLSFFLEEKIGLRSGYVSLWAIADCSFDPPRERHAFYGRCSGFLSYLDYGILKYSHSQKRFIENAVALTLSRRDALGTFDIPSYDQMIDCSLSNVDKYREQIIETQCTQMPIDVIDPQLSLGLSAVDYVAEAVEPVRRVSRSSKPVGSASECHQLSFLD